MKRERHHSLRYRRFFEVPEILGFLFVASGFWASYTLSQNDFSHHSLSQSSLPFVSAGSELLTARPGFEQRLQRLRDDLDSSTALILTEELPDSKPARK